MLGRMLGTKTIKIHNFHKIIGSVIKYRSPTPVHWNLKSVVMDVEETEHVYTFHLRTQYENMVGLNEIQLIRHGGIWYSLPHIPIWTMRDGRGKTIDMMVSDIQNKDTLLKIMGKLMETVV